MFNLSPIYSARKSSNPKISIKHKISPDTIYIKQNIHKHRTQNFRRKKEGKKKQNNIMILAKIIQNRTIDMTVIEIRLFNVTER